MNEVKTKELARDVQITLMSLFGNGRNIAEFRDIRNISERTSESLKILVELKLVILTKQGKYGAKYTPVKAKCGIPMFDLDEITEEEDFSIMAK